MKNVEINVLKFKKWKPVLTRHVGGESEVGEEPAAEGELTLPGGHAQVQLLLQQLLHLTGRQRYLSWIRSFKKSQEDGPRQMMRDERKNAWLYCTYEWMLQIINDKKSGIMPINF
jgi:hypothetical protein